MCMHCLIKALFNLFTVCFDFVMIYRFPAVACFINLQWWGKKSGKQHENDIQVYMYIYMDSSYDAYAEAERVPCMFQLQI